MNADAFDERVEQLKQRHRAIDEELANIRRQRAALNSREGTLLNERWSVYCSIVHLTGGNHVDETT